MRSRNPEGFIEKMIQNVLLRIVEVKTLIKHVTIQINNKKLF